MKKSRLFVAALVLALAFTGCGKKSAETEKQTETEVQTEAATETESETETEKQTEKQTETEIEKQTEPVVEKADSMNKTKELNGLVLSSDNSKIKIQTARGKQLEFPVTGTDIQVTGGIANGNTVKILYKGIINDTDTSDVKVQMIKDIDAMETPITEGELMTEAEEADPNAGAGVLGGSIEDLDTNRMVIRGNDGDAYYFSTYGTNINLVNGAQKGNYVTVSYKGDIFGPDIVVASSITDTDSAADKALYGPNPEGDYTYINGSMIDCGVGSVTILTDDNEELTFDIGDAAIAYYSGFVYGNYITLECDGKMKGNDTKGLKVLAIYDYEENAIAAKEASTDDSESYDEYSDDDEYSDEGDYSEEYYDEYSEEYYEE